jgi:hypothetical protein
VTGPQVLERAYAHLAKHARVIVTLLLIYVAVASVIQANHRPFWFDEVFTVTIARLPSMGDVWQALKTSTDVNPPGFYVAERFLASLVTDERVGYRLASIVTVPLACLCLFSFTRRDTDPVVGCIAAVFPLMTVFYSMFAIEARPYGLMACFLALAAVAWQRAWTPMWSFALALALMAAISVHYYALFALVPFVVAELTRVVFERRIRTTVWIAFGAAAFSLLLYWPLITSLRLAYGGQYYWAKASVFRAIASYDEYMSLITVGAMLGIVAVLSGALVVYVARTLMPRADDPIPPDIPPANCVLALGLLWLPWIALVAAKLTGGGFAARYTISAALGLALSASYVSYWLGRRASALMLMCLLTAFASKETVFWALEWYGRNNQRINVAAFDRLMQQAPPEVLPVVVSNGLDFVPLAYYAPPDSARRLVMLLDRQAARDQTGTDSVEVDVEGLKRYMPVNVQSYGDFEASNHRFLLYASPGHGEWWQARLLRDGFTMTTIAAEGSRVLYRVSK